MIIVIITIFYYMYNLAQMLKDRCLNFFFTIPETSLVPLHVVPVSPTVIANCFSLSTPCVCFLFLTTAVYFLRSSFETKPETRCAWDHCVPMQLNFPSGSTFSQYDYYRISASGLAFNTLKEQVISNIKGCHILSYFF